MWCYYIRAWGKKSNYKETCGKRLTVKRRAEKIIILKKVYKYKKL